MERLKIILKEGNTGEIQLFSGEVRAGKMDIAIKESILTVYHTEVDEAFSGKGFAKLLLEKLVGYARENNLKIIPLCPYVFAQFKRHPAEYLDVWQQS